MVAQQAYSTRNTRRAVRGNAPRGRLRYSAAGRLSGCTRCGSARYSILSASIANGLYAAAWFNLVRTAYRAAHHCGATAPLLPAHQLPHIPACRRRTVYAHRRTQAERANNSCSERKHLSLVLATWRQRLPRYRDAARRSQRAVFMPRRRPLTDDATWRMAPVPLTRRGLDSSVRAGVIRPFIARKQRFAPFRERPSPCCGCAVANCDVP